MANNNLEVTAIYTSGDTVVKETATTNNVTSFKVVDLEGPFDDNGNLLHNIEEGQVCVYIATLDKDVSTIDVKEVNWAMAYDENGDGVLKFEEIQGGHRYDKNRIWVYLQSEKATALLTIHAYTSILPSNGDSITVSVDHKQYESDLKKGDRCNGQSNTTIVTNATTPVEEKEFELEVGIRLHFLRYGFFEGHDHVDHNAVLRRSQIKDNQNELAKYSNKYSSIKNFHCHLTELVPSGYIYVIDPKKTSLEESYEYYITPKQKLRHIPWYTDPKSEDIRSLFGAKRAGKKVTEHHYHLVEYIKDKDDTPELYICYSPVQWSKAYFEKMLSDSQLREKRMTKVVCEGFEQGVTKNGKLQYAYDGLSAAFTDDNTIGFKRLKSKKEYLANSQANKTGEDAELKPDMFIPLLDPVNAAREIADEVAHNILNFKALVEAIQTGETQEDAFDRICGGGDAPPPDSDSKEYQSLYNLALTVYHMVYNDEKMIGKYDGGVDAPDGRWGELHKGESYKEWTEWTGNSAHKKNNIKLLGYDGADSAKIEGILGVAARKKLREEISKLRDDLGNFISHNDFKIPLDDYLYNAKERQLDGRVMLCQLLETLFTTTYEFDRHLLLQKDYVDTDPWKDKILDITNHKLASNYNKGNGSKAPDYQGADPLYALLTPLLNVDAVITSSNKIAKKAASALKAKLKFESARVFKQVKKSRGNYYTNWDDFVKVAVKRCNGNLRVFDTDMVGLSKKEFNVALQQALGDSYEVNTNFVHKGKYTGANPDVHRLKKKPNAVKVISTKPGDHVLEIRVRTKITEAEALDIANKRNISDKAAKILNSKGFTGFMALLDLYNLYGTVSKFGEGSTKRDKADFYNASIKLTESGLAASKAFGLKTNFFDKKIATLGTRMQFLGVVSSVATAGMCVWDAAEAFEKRDTDAAVAYSLAAVAFGVSAYAGYTAFITGAAAAGPVGWVAAIVGTGIFIIAIMLSDTAIETYFKNFLLSDDNTKFTIQANESPMVYNRRLFDNRKLLMHDDDYYKTMMHPRDAEATLMNLIVCPHVTLKPTIVQKDLPGAAPTLDFVQHLITTLKFSKFFNDKESLQVIPYFLPWGINSNPEGNNLKPMLEDEYSISQDVDTLGISINFKNRTVALFSQLILAIRLTIDDSQPLYFPYNNRSGEAVYLAIKIPLGKSFGWYDNEFNEAPTFLTKDELFKSKNW